MQHGRDLVRLALRQIHRRIAQRLPGRVFITGADGSMQQQESLQVLRKRSVVVGHLQR